MKKINDFNEESRRSSFLSVDGQEWDVSNLLLGLPEMGEDDKTPPAITVSANDVKTRSKFYSTESNDVQDQKMDYRKVPASLKKADDKTGGDSLKMLHNENLTLKRVPKYEWRRSRSPSPTSPPVCPPSRSPPPPRYRSPQPPSPGEVQPAATIHHPEPQSTQLDPPDAQVDVSSLFKEECFEHSLIEVFPGVEMPLRGSQETQYAIQKDYIMHVHCMDCTLELSCVRNSQYVLCPLCHCVSPLELSGLRLEPVSFGVGLGFVEEGI
mmetsp:Transcript_12736/g.18732  ORF Transcript_12736/g.18732 Transcript_12736/m.18732 type:complete len:267 (-) Transcript_12736:889-1689(-)|eukprot:CAMPEP_0194205390 /NCGR_PEP_ID=MMETSP0156-20130528/4668_1 /TAXON_ID=33649 /ORGANISM="Thalassionema nitzschioides, Strain L26-B" /LENGTH=266 /DNA_ID=CAMNT_0038931645 /DNA_START=112 /DNA_END=912 /DNA_ORIENTATION=-